MVGVIGQRRGYKLLRPKFPTSQYIPDIKVWCLKLSYVSQIDEDCSEFKNLRAIKLIFAQSKVEAMHIRLLSKL